LSLTGSVFRWWQAVDAPDAAFVVLDVVSVLPEYDLRGLDAEWSELCVDDPARRHVAVLVTAPGPSLESVTLNLAAPIVVNTATRQGRQLVLPEGRYAAAVRLDDALAPKKPVELAA
jgi:flagellar assembly factor FliW